MLVVLTVLVWLPAPVAGSTPSACPGCEAGAQLLDGLLEPIREADPAGAPEVVATNLVGVDPASVGALVAGGDLDGDGIGDVLHEWASVREPILHIEGRRGTDGSVLWSRSFGGRLLGDVLITAIEQKRFDEDSTADVLVFEYEQIVVSSVIVSTLRLTALRGQDGTEIGTAESRGIRVEHYGQPRRSIAVDSPIRPHSGEIFFSVGADADGDGGSDLLLGALTGHETGGSAEWTYDARVVSLAAGGSEVATVAVPGRNAVPAAWLVEDLSGDRAADVVTLSPDHAPGGGPVTVRTFAGATGEPLGEPVTFETAAVYFRAAAAKLQRSSAGDVLLVGWDQASMDPRLPLETWGLGEGERLLWRRPGTPLVAVGDVDADGTTDLFHVASVPTPDGPRVSYSVLRGEDLDVLWSTAHGPFSGANLVSTDLAPGDLNGDGVTDPVLLSATSTDAGQTLLDARVRAVDGRTGVAMWSRALPPTATNADVPRALRADVDGDGGRDLAVVTTARSGSVAVSRVLVVSGATGSDIWGPVQGPGVEGGGGLFAFAVAQDTTGDGRAEVLANLQTSAGDITHSGSVMDGRDGAQLWTLVPR